MPILQSRIRDLFERDFSMVMVVQVMLVRRVQPCKRRPLRMWEFNPEGPRAIQHFLGMTHEEMYKLFFGPQIMCPDTTEDAGLSCNRLDTQVSNLEAGHFVYICHSHYSENPPWPGMAQQGGENQVSGATSRRLAKSHHSQDAWSCAKQNALRERRREE